MSNTHPKEASLAVDGKPVRKDTFGNLDPWSEPAWCNALRSPYYNESHRRLRDALRKFMDEQVIPSQFEYEAAGDVPAEIRDKFRKSGLAFAEVPTAYRPEAFKTIIGIPWDKLDPFHLLVTADEAARVEGGIGIALNGGANVIGIPPIINHGTEEQKRQWLPALFTGETSFCLGITEPSGGSDVSNIVTSAKKTQDSKHYIVNGNKKWITGAPWASHMTTAVRTGDDGLRGISLLVIPIRNQPGVSIRRIANSGQNAGGASWVTLENVKVPVSNLLGEENKGFLYIMKNFNKERFIMAVGSNRKARTCLSTALAYAHERETFGAPLIANQVIRLKITTIAREVEAHWAWLEQITYHVQTDPLGWQSAELSSRIAMAKIVGARIQERAIREAQQVLGGNGYQKGGVGGAVEQQSRDVRMMVVGGGSEEILSELSYREELKWARKLGSKL